MFGKKRRLDDNAWSAVFRDMLTFCYEFGVDCSGGIHVSLMNRVLNNFAQDCARKWTGCLTCYFLVAPSTSHVMCICFDFRQVWEAMLSEGIVPLGGMLIPYVLALMRAGEWERALEARESFGKKQCTEANPHAPKLVLESRQNAVVDGIIAKGLMDNGQSTQALKFVLDMLEGWPTKVSTWYLTGPP